MKINAAKTHTFHICFSRNSSEVPQVTVNSDILLNKAQCKLLGVTLTSDMKWSTHVNETVRRASLRLYMLKQLRRSGAPSSDLIRVYTSFIRPVLEYAGVVYDSGLPQFLSDEIEHVQKRACRIILGQSYAGYEHALDELRLTCLENRRKSLFEKFALKLTVHDRSGILPPPAELLRALRRTNAQRCPLALTERYRRSTVPTILRSL